MFSGAGGLDIGAQLAGVKVLSSLDIFEDSVETIKRNPFFKDTLHEVGDITQLSGSHYKELLEREKTEKLIIIGGPLASLSLKLVIGLLMKNEIPVRTRVI